MENVTCRDGNLKHMARHYAHQSKNTRTAANKQKTEIGKPNKARSLCMANKAISK